MKVRIAFVFMLAIAVLIVPYGVLAAPGEGELEEELDRQLGEYDLSSWEEYYSGLPEEIRELWGGGIQELVTGFVNAEDVTDGGIRERVSAVLLAGLKRSLAPLGMILSVALMSGLAGVVLEEREGGIGAAASFVCLGMFAAAAVSLLVRLISLSGETVGRLSGFTQAVSPVIATMLAATGSVAGGGLVQPVTALISDTMNGLFKGAVLPLIAAGAGIAVAAGFAGRKRLDRLFDTLKSLLKWIIGIAFTVFLGIISIRGIAAAGADSLSVRTLKYTLDKGIPVIGGAVSGTLDTARGCAVLIKNAAGLTAILVGIGIVAAPLIEIAGASLALRIASAAAEPIADERMCAMTARMADILSYLAAAVIVTGIMFVIMLGMFIAVGQVGV